MNVVPVPTTDVLPATLLIVPGPSGEGVNERLPLIPIADVDVDGIHKVDNNTGNIPSDSPKDDAHPVAVFGP